MCDTDHIRQALIDELAVLRQRVADLETAQTSETYHTSLFHNHHAVMLLIDPDTGDIVDANPAACAFYGYTRAELTSRNITDLNTLPPEAVFEEMQRARSEQRNYFNFCHRLANGDIRDVEVYSGPVEWLGQKLLSIIHDVTARHQAERALQETAARYRSLFEDSPISLWEEDFSACKGYIDALRAEGVADLRAYFDSHPNAVAQCASLVKILDVNRATLELFRATSREELYGGLARLFGDEAPVVFKEEILALAEGHTRFHSPVQGIPLRGDPIHTLIWLTVAPGYEQTWAKVFVSVLDTTEYEQAQQALRESEERFRRLANLSFEGIVLHFRGEIIDANQTFAEMFGYTLSDLIGSDMVLLFAPESRELVAHNIETNFEETYEAVGLRADGATFPVEIMAKAAPYAGRRARVAVLRDISERQHNQQRAFELALEREKVKMLEQFIGDASHDLKTPITTMKVSLSVLRRTNDERKHQRHLDILETQAEHLQKLMEDLLNMTRLDRVVELRFTPIELYQIVQEVIAKTSTLAQRKGHKVLFSPDADPVKVHADRDKLSQAITVLVTNALNYTPEGGTVWVRVRPFPDHVSVEVQDTGIGIGKDDLPHIFERFYRADPARGTYSGGLGLGLTMAQKIVEAHRGKLEVESTPGQGSTFRIHLPL
ncbi:MAG: PAS domain S-box protein [Candidatus Methanoperedens sp.]|nr:PAS domain S-box protein [Candidatus Methanoperedens sp.]